MMDTVSKKTNNTESKEENAHLQEKKQSLCTLLSQDKEYRKKFLNTLILWWSLVSFGWQIGQMGPSLLDIKYITDTTLGEASAVFTASAVGYMVAALGTGFVIGLIHTKILLFVACFVAAATTIAIPFCSIYELMIFVNIVRGAVNGIHDTAGNTFCLRTWGADCGVYMQAIHFAFAFGGIISPLVTAPFLLPETTSTGNSSNNSEITTTSFELEKPESKLYLAFSTTTACYTLAAILFLVSYFAKREQDVAKTTKSEAEKTEFDLPLRLKVPVLVTLLILMWTYVSVETTFSGFIATFVVKMLSWSKTDASYISSVFWATFSAGRFVGIFIVRIIRPSKLLILYSVLLTLASTGLVFVSIYAVNIGVWVFVALAGFACSVIFPSVFTWIEEELLQVTGRITSLFIMASSSSGIVHPLLLGYLMDNVSPMYFCYSVLAECVIMIVLYSITKCLSFKVERFRSQKDATFDVKL